MGDSSSDWRRPSERRMARPLRTHLCASQVPFVQSARYDTGVLVGRHRQSATRTHSAGDTQATRQRGEYGALACGRGRGTGIRFGGPGTPQPRSVAHLRAANGAWRKCLKTVRENAPCGGPCAPRRREPRGASPFCRLILTFEVICFRIRPEHTGRAHRPSTSSAQAVLWRQTNSAERRGLSSPRFLLRN